MSLPMILPVGMIAVYGDGRQASTPQTALPSGLVIPATWLAGTVYNIWDGGATYIYGGNVVSWEKGKEFTRVVTEANVTMTIIPARLVTIDNPAILPP